MAITPPGAGPFTAFHLLVLALLILATLALIAAGVRRSRARRASAERVEAEAAAAGVPEQSAEPAPVALDRAPVVEPAPAPLAPDPLVDERIAAAAPIEASPAPIADPTPADPVVASSPVDGPVTQLKGLGPKVATRLAELGLSTVGQIAALDADRAAAVDAQLGPFAGRLHRDRWVEQARFLAAGDTKGFEAVFGRL